MYVMWTKLDLLGFGADDVISLLSVLGICCFNNNLQMMLAPTLLSLLALVTTVRAESAVETDENGGCVDAQLLPCHSPSTGRHCSLLFVFDFKR
jgi:hypothetical protein